jgi:superfamily II DNA helicase RecQ
MAQYKAGYILENILSPNTFLAKKWQRLLSDVSSYEMTGLSVVAGDNSFYTVLSNAIGRGLPTRMTGALEQRFLRNFNVINVDNDEFCAALHLIDPRLELHSSDFLQNLFDSNFERNFLDKLAQTQPFLLQLLCLQRPFGSIVPQAARDFFAQRVDGALDYPYSNNENNFGLIVEIDGVQHSAAAQQVRDQNRDTAAQNAKYSTQRFTSLENVATWANTIVAKEAYLKTTAKIYQNKIFSAQRAATWTLALAPTGIARIQKTLLQALQSGQLSLNMPIWRIVVIERDVPCAQWAIDDLCLQIKHLYNLAGIDVKLPIVELQVYASAEFQNSPMHKNNPPINLANLPTVITADLCIDIAMLQRGQYAQISENTVLIRSAYYAKSNAVPRISCAEAINYGALGEYIPNPEENVEPEKIIAIEDKKQSAINFFVNYFFRKEGLRPGQADILNLALQNKSVIGLMPTGGGKSLVYQLAGLLQAGLSLVIDPIKSLMQDQVDNLILHRIDVVAFINSNLEGERLNQRIAQFSAGNFLFTFVSPERLQTIAFREILSRMHEQKKYFSYGIIDEAHCVSEWGHDFRTAYLMLGRNILRFARPFDLNKTLPLLGLTATASFDVLTDIQRELSTPNVPLPNENIINFTNTALRPELIYQVVNGVDSKIETPSQTPQNQQAELSKAKRQDIFTIIKNVPNHLAAAQQNPEMAAHRIKNLDENSFHLANDEGKYLNAGLLFCPHKSNNYGVAGVLFELRKLRPDIQFSAFMGGDDENNLDVEKEQRDFIQNDTQLMIATKAFGMGIDKPNVRYTIHFCLPSSLEGFVQEAGRAGRDKKIAIAYLLYPSKTVYKAIDKDKLMFFHQLSFAGKNREKYLLVDVMTELQENSVISFANSKQIYLEVLAILKTDVARDVTISMLQDTDSLDKLIANARIQYKTNTKKDLPDMLDSTKQQIGAIFKHYRAKNDTEKALYRLMLLGYIEDYTVDFGAKTFNVRRANNTIDFQKRLGEYLLRYYSENRVTELLKDFDSRKGKNDLQRALSYLIDFVYDEVERKRLEGINSMIAACEEGRANGNEALKQYIFYYFSSKYARKNYQENGKNCSLNDRTNEGRNESQAIFVEFAILAGSTIDNLKHLRGATMRLLAAQPQNTCLRLLRAFAIFSLDSRRLTSPSVQTAQNEFIATAFMIIQRDGQPIWDKYFNLFRRELLANQSHLANFINNLQQITSISALNQPYQKLLIDIKKLSDLYV